MEQNIELHKCSREECPTSNVNGSKILCFVCAKQFYGKCFGIEDEFYEAYAPKSPFVSESNIQFICPHCLRKPKKDALKESGMANDLVEIKESLNMISKSQTDCERKIASISNVSVILNGKLKDVCRKIDAKISADPRKPLFADVVRSTSNETPLSRAAKRLRQENENLPNNGVSSVNTTPIRPKPRMGTLEAVIGPSMPQSDVLRPYRRFDRSIWVSRFHPETTIDQVMDYIVGKMGDVDKQNFNCRKLVKKDADLSSMQFVSFKIDVMDDFFEKLSDPQIWPKYILVREFFSERRVMNIPAIKLPGVISSGDQVTGSGTGTSDLGLGNQMETNEGENVFLGEKPTQI